MQHNQMQKTGRRSVMQIVMRSLFLTTKEKLLIIQPAAMVYGLSSDSRGHRRSLEMLLLVVLMGPNDWLDSIRVNRAAEVKSGLLS